MQCSYCHDTMGILARCTGCGTMSHIRCVANYGKCPTVGCNIIPHGHVIKVRPRPVKKNLILTFVDVGWKSLCYSGLFLILMIMQGPFRIGIYPAAMLALLGMKKIEE